MPRGGTTFPTWSSSCWPLASVLARRLRFWSDVDLDAGTVEIASTLSVCAEKGCF